MHRHMSLTSLLLCAVAGSSRRFLLQSGEHLAPPSVPVWSEGRIHVLHVWWLMRMAPSRRVSLQHVPSAVEPPKLPCQLQKSSVTSKTRC